MDYLVFIDQTRDMNPQQRGMFFNGLTEDEQTILVDQAGDIELIMVHTRMVIGAERIEAEQPSPKRDHMQRIYDKLADEYMQVLSGVTKKTEGIA